MANDVAKRSSDSPSGFFRLLDGRASVVEKLYAQSQAACWGLSLERFSLSRAKCCQTLFGRTRFRAKTRGLPYFASCGRPCFGRRLRHWLRVRVGAFFRYIQAVSLLRRRCYHLAFVERPLCPRVCRLFVRHPLWQ